MIRQSIRWARLFPIVIAAVLLASCNRQEPADEGLYRAVDELYEALSAKIKRFEVVAAIDHSRLAAEAGEIMPPARVIIFSDPDVNTAILRKNPMAGLDLPFRVLAYAEGDSGAVIYTPASFLERRYDLGDMAALRRYQASVRNVLRAVPDDVIVEFGMSPVTKGRGIVSLDSLYDFDETVQRLKDTVMAEGDTIWFGEIDYQNEAEELGFDLPRLTLLLFGAPGPGAKAMAEHPRMGLDAFCQKLLVYQKRDGRTGVLFNDMAALAELHYGDSSLPHQLISQRMRSTLGDAVGE
jgi:uncharacterized protein (DUF302 family)